jgi:hypothetical protein
LETTEIKEPEKTSEETTTWIRQETVNKWHTSKPQDDRNEMKQS